ncbi:hypothetical protein FsymDg_1651 [Candidatus Protofrankia datiscae]|uniref:Uncharacterized protein n=1 Tax=Candidatus Protofrankia datiscae TaxID=2716812 RepID=F8B4Q4_9ACTN|nr:hypothetical protein FsymDg_1651 [Candidatus Protofrankia datiscae]
MPVAVDPDRQQAVDVDHTATLADLHRQRVGLHEPVGAGIERPGAERLDLGVELFRQCRDLGFRDVRDAELLDKLVDSSRGDPEQVGGGDHRDQCLLGTASPGQEPFREIGTGPQLGNSELDRARPSVPLAHPVAVPTVDPFRRYLPIFGIADTVRLGAHQRFSEHLHHRAQKIRTRRGEFLAEPLGVGHSRAYGHRVAPYSSSSQVLGRITRWSLYVTDRHSGESLDRYSSYTTSMDSSPDTGPGAPSRPRGVVRRAEQRPVRDRPAATCTRGPSAARGRRRTTRAGR